MRDDVKRKKITILTAVLTVIVLVSIVIFSVVSMNGQITHFPDVDDGPGEEVDEKSLVFYNRSILTLAYNADFSSIVLDNISTVVFSKEEMQFSKNNSPVEGDSKIYYDATIDAGGLISYGPYANKFNVKISDEREYQVVTETDSLDNNFSYVYTGISRVGGDRISILINGSEENKDSFVKFAKEKIGKDLVDVSLIKSSAELSSDDV